MKKWYAYQTKSPIDTGWEQLKTVEETVEFLATAGEDELDDDGFPLFSDDLMQTRVLEKFDDLLQFIVDYKQALVLAESVGWEGDICGHAYVFWVPDADFDFAYCFMWKQGNNGNTYVVSPHTLPWLDAELKKLT